MIEPVDKTSFDDDSDEGLKEIAAFAANYANAKQEAERQANEGKPLEVILAGEGYSPEEIEKMIAIAASLPPPTPEEIGELQREAAQKAVNELVEAGALIRHPDGRISKGKAQ